MIIEFTIFEQVLFFSLFSVLAGKTRPVTRPSVADGWAGAEVRVFPLFDQHYGPTDGRTDGWTDGPMDGQSLLYS